jgi:hypothetical protein
LGRSGMWGVEVCRNHDIRYRRTCELKQMVILSGTDSYKSEHLR